MNNKIKIFISAALVITMLLTGTFAWVNFSQNMLNEFEGEAGKKPGGSGHDDFDEPNKDVYVENWGETNIYVRIRLDEYMEIGEGAGKKGTFIDNNWISNPENNAVSLIPGANINDMATWSPHIPDGAVEICDTPADFHSYWDWKMGGWKYYMPAPEDKRTEPSYIDQNTNVYDGTEPGVKKTLNAEAVTMQEWISLGKPVGNFWVIDADGWAYWAAPLKPGEATGLLLSEVNRIFEPDDSYYYAINVIVQMATKFGDFNYENFYDGSDGDHNATDNGKDLLDVITGDEQPEQPTNPAVPATGVTINGGDKEIYAGSSYRPGCTIEPADSTEKPVWSSSEESVAAVDPDTGKITGIIDGEAIITVTVGDKTDSITITVTTPSAEIPATGVTINEDDIELDIGGKHTPDFTVEPSDSTDKPIWSSSDESVAVVDPDTGEITGIGEGEAVITVTVGDETDSVTVTVKPSEDPKIPTNNGEGPYDTRYSENPLTQNLNYALKCKNINGTIIPAPSIDQDGSIKLSDVISGGDYTGIGVKPVESKYDGYFSIGLDKDGDPAIIYTYIPDVDTWIDAMPETPVISGVKLLLTKDGYQDTLITTVLRYNGSLFDNE